jgi:hypothetical protein
LAIPICSFLFQSQLNTQPNIILDNTSPKKQAVPASFRNQLNGSSA